MKRWVSLLLVLAMLVPNFLVRAEAAEQQPEGAETVEYAEGEMTTPANQASSDGCTGNTSGSWTAWSTTKPTGVDESLIESRKEYRYQNKWYTTGTSSYKNGWTLYDITTEWSDYGSWSSWQDSSVTADDYTKVEKRTVYGYYYFKCGKCGAHMHGYGTCWTWAGGCGAKTYESGWTAMHHPTSWNNAGLKDWHGTGKYYTYLDGQLWFKWPEGGSKTQYRYCSRTKNTVYHFYQWGSWSDWSTSYVSANSERNVETRTVYRYWNVKYGSHNYQSKVTAPTCTAKGYTTYTCKACGDSYKDNYTDKVSHSYGNWSQTKAPTCTAKGTERRDCSKCDKYETRDVAAKGHTLEKISGKAATCTATGLTDGKKCSVCGTVTVKQESIPAKGHTEVKVGGKAATCTQDGLTDGKKCSVCGTVTVEQERIPATGVHEYVSGVCKHCGTAEPSKVPAPVLKVSNDPATGKIKLSWKAVAPDAEYYIYSSDRRGGTDAYLTFTQGTSYTDNSAVAGETYYYRVMAVSGDQKSAYSEYVSATCDLPRPKIKLTNDKTSGKIKVSWNEVDGAVKYQILRRTKQGNFSLLAEVDGNSYLDIGAKAGTRYYYKVRAVHKVEEAKSAYSEVKNGVCDLPQPKVTASNVAASGKVKLTWGKVNGAQKYQVFRSTTGKDGSFKRVATVTNTSYTDKNGQAGSTYYYKVKAVHSNTNANSALSARVKAVCKPKKPTGLTLTKNGANNKYLAQWNAVEGATGYQIKYTVGGVSKLRPLTKNITKTPVTGTQCELTLEKKNKPYTIQVRSYIIKDGKTYWSEWSAKKTVTWKK